MTAAGADHARSRAFPDVRGRIARRRSSRRLAIDASGFFAFADCSMGRAEHRRLSPSGMRLAGHRIAANIRGPLRGIPRESGSGIRFLRNRAAVGSGPARMEGPEEPPGKGAGCVAPDPRGDMETVIIPASARRPSKRGVRSVNPSLRAATARPMSAGMRKSGYDHRPALPRLLGRRDGGSGGDAQGRMSAERLWAVGSAPGRMRAVSPLRRVRAKSTSRTSLPPFRRQARRGADPSSW